jgi:hypothetical protein
VFSSDIDRFWVAYDSVRTTSDRLRQAIIFTRLYLERGTLGLRTFQEVEGYTAAEWVRSIRQHPKFWNSIRPSTQLAKAGAQNLGPYLTKFRQLYPQLRPASIYFTIGALRSGGTTKDSLVLVGAELVTGNPQTDISEFTGDTHAFLASVFARNPFEAIIPLNVHEYAHTQEYGPGNTVLGQALYEGTCDLVAELVTGKKMDLPYMRYGPMHEAELKERFKLEIFTANISSWFYLLDASVREIRVEFSVPMAPNHRATDYGPGGKAQYPVTKQLGFSADNRSYTYQVALQPGHTYSFILNGGGFEDTNGYPLKQYEVKFRTRD